MSCSRFAVAAAWTVWLPRVYGEGHAWRRLAAGGGHGEHTSQDYQGYMEGGAETGGFVAAEILEDLETALPLGLVRALGVKLLIPQAGYRARSWAPMNAFQRKRIARQQIARALDLLQSGHVAP